MTSLLSRRWMVWLSCSSPTRPLSSASASSWVELSRSWPTLRHSSATLRNLSNHNHANAQYTHTHTRHTPFPSVGIDHIETVSYMYRPLSPVLVCMYAPSHSSMYAHSHVLYCTSMTSRAMYMYNVQWSVY